MKIELIQIMSMIALLLTMPVSFMGFGVLYGEGADGKLMAFIVQALVFLAFWYLAYRHLLKRYTKSLIRIKDKRTETGTDAQQNV